VKEVVPPAKPPVRENEVRAEAKYVRVSARKARLVTEHIVAAACPRRDRARVHGARVAKEIEKVLHSAVSNAEANHGMIGDELFVSTVYVDEGGRLGDGLHVLERSDLDRDVQVRCGCGRYGGPARACARSA